MTADSQDVRKLLLQTDEEFRQLAARHQELDQRLHELSAKHYLSQPEQIEETTLKKRKLQLKDRMEDIVRRSQHLGNASMTAAHPGP
ncbi:MAG: YdcH family protein [Acidobacteria bacterium]|nr:YdcH family protein [Acidobacteriota bacterium]MBI3264500.1 YdcH family protein [Acidobacteriota bacterium]